MAQIVASSFSKVTAPLGTSSFPVALPVGVIAGDIIVVTASTFTSGVTLSSSDMTALISQTTSGTLISMQWWHSYQGVAPTVDTVFPASRGMIVHVLILRDAGTPIAGVVSSRPAQGGTTTTQAAAMTAAENGALGLAFFTERTSAAETPEQVTVASPWTKDYYAYDTTSGSIETITVASQATTSGTTAVAIATYPNSQTNNGTGWQLSVPTVVIPPQPTPNHPIVVTSSITSAHSGVSGVTSLAVPKPSGIITGDYLVAVLHNQSASASTFNTPAGWTKLGELIDATANGYRRNAYFGHSVTDPSAVPPSVTFSVAGTSGRMTGFMAIVKQVDHADPVGTVSTIGDITNVTTTTLSMDSLVLESSSSLVLLAVHIQQSAAHDNPLPFTTVPGTVKYSELITNEAGQTSTVSRTASTLFGLDADTSATFPASVTTFASAVDNRTALAIELKYAPQVSLVGDGWPVYDGAADPALLYYANASGEPRTPSYLTTMPPGYPSVAAMLAEPLFFIAHRGGSRNFPEMSLHAYTQSVARSYGALEISLARTSDGVYFGLHDSSLDRTSLGTTGTTLNPETMTWAQVQAYSILPPSTAAPSEIARPYMRWEEIIATYASTHILFIDPKVVDSQYHDIVLDMMDALPGATDRMVAKFYGVSGGVGNTGWAGKATDRGYQTWGYFYQADSANFAAYQGRWSILGMEYGADQTTWNTILSYGKPVIGHVIPSMTNAQTAVDRGAAGLMVSEVIGIDPKTAPDTLLP